ncbi:S24/S26 family peptidase [Herbivorax sp. ANBcel31]|uniref:S24/S26 family peptidase n=1 Tax=Herbivorax sp. ANBcel31 TaxID=3069754 RepID=UPI0027B31AF7|nr:S24/S26 family peptidase [Herbivorax sp. ANBcel31]MDQ2087366.1 S24/S26 family peptidase [Herbivorax sp. ANBcel31]
MINKIMLSQAHELIEEVLNNEGEIVLTVMGNSMYPMLRNKKDSVCIVRPLNKVLKKYDIPLFIRDDGKYVLHRIVDVRSDGYVLIGDNQYKKEYSVLHSQVVGVVKGFWRNGKYFSCDNIFYNIYIRFWKGIFPLRLVLKKVKSIYGRSKTWRKV